MGGKVQGSEGGGGGEGEGRGYEGVEWLRVSRVRGEEAKESTVGGGERGGGYGGGGGKGGKVRGSDGEGKRRKTRGETRLRGRRVASRKALRRPLLSGTQHGCTIVYVAHKNK